MIGWCDYSNDWYTICSSCLTSVIHLTMVVINVIIAVIEFMIAFISCVELLIE